jgi:hypothetical protein
MDPSTPTNHHASLQPRPDGAPPTRIGSAPGATGPEAHREETEEIDDALRWALSTGEEGDPLDCVDPVAVPPPPPCPPHYWLISEGPGLGVQVWRCHHCGLQKELTRVEESGPRTWTDRRRSEVPTPSFGQG